jgi:hypothetical protein
LNFWFAPYISISVEELLCFILSGVHERLKFIERGKERDNVAWLERVNY